MGTAGGARPRGATNSGIPLMCHAESGILPSLPEAVRAFADLPFLDKIYSCICLLPQGILPICFGSWGLYN